MKRYYFADTITNFLKKSDNEVLAELDRGSREYSSLYSAQGRSWDKELLDLRPMLDKYSNRGTIVFEYTIPRLGRRIDVILLINGIVFILEYKAFKDAFLSADAIQVFDYALDLKNFHKESENRYIVPILVVTDAEAKGNVLEEYRDHIFAPLLCNTATLSDTIDYCMATIPKRDYSTDEDWLNSKYEPTPTIIEAVTHMYKNHSVKDIARHGSEDNDFFKTCGAVKEIISFSKVNHHKSICFVTGVPGAGKTLVGMDIAAEYIKEQDRAVYLSGNGPLVEVLCEALARDMVAQSKSEREKKIADIRRASFSKKEEANAIRTIEKAKTKKVASSEVQAIIQMVHRYRKACLENTIEKDGKIIEDIENRNSNTSNYIPIDHIAIFDEAQRAWTKKGLASFMKDKHHWNDFPMSEPEFLISCLDRHKEWGVVVCLVGGGQEINHDEAGIDEWIKAINRSYPSWHVFISNKLYDSEYMAGQALSELELHHKNVHKLPELHLAVSRRSFKAERLASFVKALLDIDVQAANNELQSLNDYPLFITRDLNAAKKKLRQWAKGSSDRYGLLVSSKASRLKPLAIDVRVKPSVTAYFLNGPDDIRSSLFLEDAASEFDVQGLELDWTCLVWDADFQYKEGRWAYHKIGSKKDDDDESVQCWRNINDPVLRHYQKNAYRVLLTRARQGMIICVPEGDINDMTRNPELYDSTYSYLKDVIGIKELSDN